MLRPHGRVLEDLAGANEEDSGSSGPRLRPAAPANPLPTDPRDLRSESGPPAPDPGAIPAHRRLGRPIHKVASPKGRFRSSDLKDYLGLPPDRKLILSTCAPDDYQEMPVGEGAGAGYALRGARHRLLVSGPLLDLRRRQQALPVHQRQAPAAPRRAHREPVRLVPPRPEHPGGVFLAPVRGSSSVLFSSQQTFTRRHRAIVQDKVRIADGWFPPEAAFFIVGGELDLPISRRRRVYQVHTRWLLLALKGRNLANRPEPTKATGDLAGVKLEGGVDPC